MTEAYIAQILEEIEVEFTKKKLSQERSRTESRILGALCRLDEFLLSPRVRIFSRTVPRTFQNNVSENRELTGDHSQNDPYPEVEFSSRQTSNSVDSDQEETSHMVTRIQEEIFHISPGTSSGKQKKARSRIQPYFRSEKTPATIEADEIL